MIPLYSWYRHLPRIMIGRIYINFGFFGKGSRHTLLVVLFDPVTTWLDHYLTVWISLLDPIPSKKLILVKSFLAVRYGQTCIRGIALSGCFYVLWWDVDFVAVHISVRVKRSFQALQNRLRNRVVLGGAELGTVFAIEYIEVLSQMIIALFKMLFGLILGARIVP